VTDAIGPGKNGLKVGEILRFEPYMEELQRQEWRFFSYLDVSSSKKGMRNIYSIQTELLDDGRVHTRKVASRDQIGLDKNQKIKVGELCRKTMKLLMETNNSGWRGIRYLFFRLDLVVGNGKEGQMFLNEIDVFPVAVTFIDDYVTGEHYIQNMAELTYKYLLEHSRNEMPWPM
jgi:hypothetical protein